MTPIESEIRQPLLLHIDPRKAAGRLLAEARPELVAREDLLAIATFALHAGAHIELATAMVQWLSSAPQFPWAALVQLLTLHRIKISRELVDATLEGAASQQALAPLALCHSWDKFAPQLAEARRTFLQELSARHRGRKNALKEKLSFTRIHRLIEEEQKVLKQLQREFPDDEDVARERENFAERWAREIIARNLDARELEITEPEIDPADRERADLWLLLAQELAAKSDSAAYDLALLFQFIGLPDYALQVQEAQLMQKALSAQEALHVPVAPQAQEALPERERGGHTPAQEWLTLELLYQARRYIDCLDAIQRVEMRYFDDPEAAFGAIYLRALCLWELNQNDMAIELMKSITHIRPDYRSARSFLAKWNGTGGRG